MKCKIIYYKLPHICYMIIKVYKKIYRNKNMYNHILIYVYICFHFSHPIICTNAHRYKITEQNQSFKYTYNYVSKKSTEI